jgi:hypothetical protein
MADRRQATRPDPVPVYVVALDREILVPPLPWRKRNDLGNLIVELFSDALNAEVKERAEEGFVTSFFDAKFDYQKVFELVWPPDGGNPPVNLDDLTWGEMLEVCHALCEVNGLEKQLFMIDPNFQSPESNSSSESEAVEDGPKILSLVDSSTVESASTTSSD